MKSMVYPSLPVLLVDDEEAWLHGFTLTLGSAGINHVLSCQDSREVMDLLAQTKVGVVVLDLTMPHISGQDILKSVGQEYPEISVIVISGANELETAVDCMRNGAFDYFVKTVETERLVGGVRRAIELSELREEHALLKARFLDEELEQPEIFEPILTNSNKMWGIFRYLEAIAPSNQPVLVLGETGVGKELFANAVHALGNREGPFVAVNVAGLDDHVFSDTLFGHKKGAFTGADAARPGLVERAAFGTLFLDEIGDLSMNSQVKLLRLLQEREFYPLGSDVAKKSDANIVVATNRDLKAMMESGEFRKDLYYRLGTHCLKIPPLRERKEDLALLLDSFLEEAAQSLDRKRPSVPKELIILLRTYCFPGNVRELKTMVFDAVSHHKGGILSLDVFKKHIRNNMAQEPDMPLMQNDPGKAAVAFSETLPTLKEVSALLIGEAMKRANGNQAIAANMLGISRQALNYRLRQST